MAPEVRQNWPLAPLTTMQVGGPAAFFAQWRDATELQGLLNWAQQRALPVYVLSGGSNVLIADAGLPGLVVQAAPKPLELLEQTTETVLLRAPAGLVWQTLVDQTVAHGWQGLECMTGIPGLCGAAPIQNIGAYGQEVAAVVEWVEQLELATGRLSRIANAACGFAYRDSRWKRAPGTAIVTAVALRLQRSAAPCTAYAQVRDALQAAGVTQPSVADVARCVQALRREKSMWLDPGDPDTRSCGSFFVNPIVETDTAEAAVQRLARAGDRPPQWPQPDGQVKLSAAWLIERSGMPKGYGDGGPVGLSRAHTLALVNRGGATCGDVLRFAQHVRQRVLDASGVALEREPVLLGG